MECTTNFIEHFNKNAMIVVWIILITWYFAKRLSLCYGQVQKEKSDGLHLFLNSNHIGRTRYMFISVWSKRVSRIMKHFLLRFCMIL